MGKKVRDFYKSTLGKIALILSTFPVWKILYNIIDAWGNLLMATDYLLRIWHFLNTAAGTFIVMFIGFGLMSLQLYRQEKQARRAGEIGKLDTPNLTFEIDALRSQIHVSSHPYEDFNVVFQLYVRFENSDIHPLTVRSVSVLLMKRNEDKTESEIPRDELLIYTRVIENDLQVEHSWESRNLSIKGRELTLYHRIEGYIAVSGDYREILDKDCFLRVTMDAMNQPPYSLDFNVKWQNISLGWIPITPGK